MIYFELDKGWLLKKAMSPLRGILENCFVRYSPEGISLTLTNDERNFMGVLRMRSSEFQDFECDGEEMTFIDFDKFYGIVRRVLVDERFAMHSDPRDRHFYYWIHHHSTNFGASGHLRKSSVVEEEVEPDYSQIEYDVFAGITAKKFRFFLRNLGDPRYEVSMFITDKQVKFSTEKGEIVLQTEFLECIIGGAVKEEPVEFHFTVEYIKQLWKASLLTSVVWILYAPNSPILFNFPIGPLGNIMFHLGDHTIYSDRHIFDDEPSYSSDDYL